MEEKLFIFAVVVAVMVVIIVGAAIASKRRREAMTALAQRLGLFYAPDSHDVHVKYEGFLPFGRGRGRRSKNLLHGYRGEIQWEIFDYRFRTGSGKNARTHHYGIVAATVPIVFRKLTIRPEGFFDRIAQFAGFDDINFESAVFSQRYHVSCDVRKFAYDVIHPRMIEFLLTIPAHHWQLGGNVILIHQSGHFKPEQLEQAVRDIEQFVQLIPEYVRQGDTPAAPSAPPQRVR